jgi:hypothetical protein
VLMCSDSLPADARYISRQRVPFLILPATAYCLKCAPLAFTDVCGARLSCRLLSALVRRLRCGRCARGAGCAGSPGCARGASRSSSPFCARGASRPGGSGRSGLTLWARLALVRHYHRSGSGGRGLARHYHGGGRRWSRALVVSGPDEFIPSHRQHYDHDDHHNEPHRCEPGSFFAPSFASLLGSFFGIATITHLYLLDRPAVLQSSAVSANAALTSVISD